jgi:hypothetical protein
MASTAPHASPSRGLRVEDAWRAQAEMFGEPLRQVAREPAPAQSAPHRGLGWVLPVVAVGMVSLLLGTLALLSLIAVGLALLP